MACPDCDGRGKMLYEKQQCVKPESEFHIDMGNLGNQNPTRFDLRVSPGERVLETKNNVFDPTPEKKYKVTLPVRCRISEISRSRRLGRGLRSQGQA